MLVERWNRVADVWRNERCVPKRRCYATLPGMLTATRQARAYGRKCVYPLIERARWHRRMRSRSEAIWDYLCGPHPARSRTPGSYWTGQWSGRCRPRWSLSSTTRWT